ncbi:hypothetical protein EC991_004402 [Linnemannia zychae]|nr:hypothetical protein EC991_004402 [Linnemannia zychae]
MDNNIPNNDDPMVVLMVRAIGQSPILPNQQHQQQQQQQSATHASPLVTASQSTPALAASNGGGIPGSSGPVASVEFLDAEAETALFLDPMMPSANNSLSSPLPLPLPWSPSQDMIWTEDEILAGGAKRTGEGGVGDDEGEGGVVDMNMDDDLAGATGIDMVTAQEMDDGTGVMGRAVLMDEDDDEVLPVVVIETVTPTSVQPVSPVTGFGSSQRTPHQQHHQQQQQQQQGGVRFNSPQLNNSGGFNRARSFGKGDHHTPLRMTTTGFGAVAASQRSGDGSGGQPRSGGVEVGGVGNGALVTSVPVAEGQEKPNDMDIDTPEVLATTMSIGAGAGTGTGAGAGLMKGVQPTSFRDLQEPQGSSSTTLSPSQHTIAPSILAPALEPKPVPAASSIASKPESGLADVQLGAESTTGTVALSIIMEPVTVEPEKKEEATESETITTMHEKTPPPPPIDESKHAAVTTPLSGTTPPHSPSSPQPTTTTLPSKPPTKKRQRPCEAKPAHHHPSWHFAPGSDIAFLSEMKASDADLRRFRREHEWLEERVQRPKRDLASDQLLDKALGLTRMVVVPSPTNPKRHHYHRSAPQLESKSSTEQDKDKSAEDEKEGRENNKENKDEMSLQQAASKKRSSVIQDKEVEGNDKEQAAVTLTTATITPHNKYIAPVRLSTDSRLAFSILKTNLSAELEEQTRLEADQQILEKIVQRTATKLSTTAELYQKAESRLRELQSRQPDQEKELQKLERLERACLELRDRQRAQAEEEVRQLEETVRLLVRGREERGREDLRRAERARVEMGQEVASTSAGS